MRSRPYIFLYTGIAVFMLSISACKKDIKDVTDPNSYNSANFPQTPAQLKSVLGGIYAQLRDQSLWGTNLNAKMIFPMDHTIDLGYLGDAGWSQLCQNSYANSSYAGSLWAGLYIGVQRANTFLASLDNYKKKYAAAAEATELSYEEGEARFLRALYYFYLVNIYGQSNLQNGGSGDLLGVPLVTTVAASLQGSYVKQNTIRQVWDFIISELITADTKLQKHSWDAPNISRVPGWAPNALLGKAYLFSGDYANAKKVLKDVIDNSGHTLMSFDIYKNMFNGANKFNNESFFEINNQLDVSGFGVYWGPNITSSAGLIYSPTLMNINDTTAVANGYGNEFLHDKNLARFGFNLPIWNMTPNPNFNPGKPDGPYNVRNICDPNYVSLSQALRSSQSVDPRLYVSALQPWVDTIATDSASKSVRRVVLRAKEIPNNLKLQYYGWSLRKYAPLEHNIINLKGSDLASFYILRLADIYLLYAEACAQTSDDATALEYVNKVHRRAYGYGPDASSPLDYKSLSDATRANDPVLGNNPLRYERWAELFGEGGWWFDVVRWKIGDKEAAYYQKTIPGTINWTNTSYYFPIPTNELNNNPSMKQNNGY